MSLLCALAVICTADVTVPAACSTADPRSDSGCTAQINAALQDVSDNGGGRVLLEADERYLVICPATVSPVPQPMEAAAGSYPTFGPSALYISNSRDLVFGSTSEHIAAAIVVDFSPQPCAMLTVLNSSNITIMDLTLDALRPAQTLARMTNVAADGASFTAWVPTPTATANTSFAGAASGAQAWLGAIETIQPVEQLDAAEDDEDGPWQFAVPNPSRNSAVYVWRDPATRLAAKFDESTRLLHIAFDGSAQLAGMASAAQWVSLRHWVYGGDAVFAVLSRDLVVERVVVYSAAGMGFRADLATGGRTAFRQVQVRTRKGRASSIAADAVHFMSCAGAVELSDSLFENHGDDGVNVHGQFEVVTSVSTDRRNVTFRPGWQTAVPFAVGTEFRFRDRVTLEHLGDASLTAVIPIQGGELQATFAESLSPALVALDAIFTSLAFAPATILRNNTWRRCRCRGAVLSTGPAPLVVANNTFLNTTRSAVLLLDGGVEDNAYMEGPFTANATITGNTMVVHPDGYFRDMPGWDGNTLVQSKGAVQVGAGAGLPAVNGTVNTKTSMLYLGNASLFGSLLIANNTVVMNGPSQPAVSADRGERDHGRRLGSLTLYFPTAAVHVGNAKNVTLRRNRITYLETTGRRYRDLCVYNSSTVAADGNECESVGGGSDNCTLSLQYCGL